VLVSSGCGDEPAAVLVDVKTDFVPGEEFAAARVTLNREGASPIVDETIALFGDDYLSGIRVSEFETTPGAVTLRTELVATGGEILASQVTRARVAAGATGITVVLSRDCANVTCPGPDDPSDLQACLGSQCVSPYCTEESPDECGPPACTAASDCVSSVACAVPRCVAGACLFGGDDSACGSSEYCDPTTGCRARAGVMDSGTPDAAPDAPDDATSDAAPDGGSPRCPAGDPAVVALYTFDASDLSDSVGGRDGRAVGGALTYVAGPPGCGTAVAFPGAGTIYGIIDDAATFDIGPTGSVDFWFLTDAATTTHVGLLSRDQSGSSPTGQLNLAVTIDGSPYARIQTAAGEAVVCGPPGLAHGMWHHFGVNFGPPGFELFVDGMRMDENREVPIVEPPSDTTFTCGTNTDGDLTGSMGSLPIYLGVNNGYSSAGTTDDQRGFFRDGAIDHLRFSNERRDFTVYATP
jgi:hypothetical protein